VWRLVDFLASGLTRLKQLHLISRFRQNKMTLKNLSTAEFSHPLSILVLEKFAYAPGSLLWLKVFSELDELHLRHSLNHFDLETQCFEVFQTCPKLLSLIDTRTYGVSTVGKTHDGRLITRRNETKIVFEIKETN
jgi:hypothetical protein